MECDSGMCSHRSTTARLVTPLNNTLYPQITLRQYEWAVRKTNVCTHRLGRPAFLLRYPWRDPHVYTWFRENNEIVQWKSVVSKLSGRDKLRQAHPNKATMMTRGARWRQWEAGKEGNSLFFYLLILFLSIHLPSNSHIITFPSSHPDPQTISSLPVQVSYSIMYLPSDPTEYSTNSTILCQWKRMIKRLEVLNYSKIYSSS